jgi:hypothetical protein
MSAGLKIIIGSAVGLLLSFGLCGLGSVMTPGMGRLGVVGADLFLLSLLGLLLGFLVVIVGWISGIGKDG